VALKYKTDSTQGIVIVGFIIPVRTVRKVWNLN